MSDVSSLLGRQVAGKYLIEAHVGGGAMGEVYRARHVALDTSVAIKIMRGDTSREPTFRQRFLREARAASRLEHVNSVRVLDFGEEPDGLVYLAMEYLAGRDLHTLLREEGPLDDVRIVDLLAQTLGALAVAHGLGIVHRDLKPENIMVLARFDEDGSRDLVKVCDFGLAKLADTRGASAETSGKALTVSGAIVGTPEYMSPEQARGDTLDARSDIYAIGVILYEMLTGQVPFTAGNALGVVLKQVMDPPARPSTLRPSVNPRLEAICLRALAKAPADRYPSAGAMRAELRGALLVSSGPRLPAESDPSLAATLPTAIPVVPQLTAGASPSPAPSRAAPTSAASRRLRTSRAALGVVTVAGLLTGALVVVVVGKRGRTADDAPSASVGPGRSARPARTRLAASASPRTPTRSSASSTASAPSPPPPSTTGSADAEASPSPEPGETYRPTAAFVGLGSTHAENVSPEAIARMVGESAPTLSECYRDALRIAGAPVDGAVEMSLSIDEAGRVRSAVVDERRLPSFARCAQNAVLGRSVGATEGPATATQWLTLHP